MGILFNGASKLITLTPGTSVLGVRDLWSRWIDWLKEGDNSKYPVAFGQVGGEAIDPTAGTSIPVYIFMLNGWKIMPQASDHTLRVVDGVLIVAGGGDPFVNPPGSYTIRINYSQPVQAITVATGGSSGPSAGDIAKEVWGYKP